MQKLHAYNTAPPHRGETEAAEGHTRFPSGSLCCCRRSSVVLHPHEFILLNDIEINVTTLTIHSPRPSASDAALSCNQ
jgi:hypothetical protein